MMLVCLTCLESTPHHHSKRGDYLVCDVCCAQRVSA